MLNESLETKKVNVNLMREIFNEIVKERKLEEYVKNISINEEDTFSKPCYIPYTRTIMFPINEKMKLTEERLFELFKIFYHELYHAKDFELIQKFRKNQELTEKEREKVDIILEGNKRILKRKVNYIKYHDYFATERNANYYSLIDANEKLKELLSDNDYYKENENKRIGNKLLFILLYGYEYKLFSKGIISPSEAIYKRKTVEKFNDYELSEFEKMLYGLPIDYNLFNTIMNDLTKSSGVNSMEYVKHLHL